jgi:hypothetical protein
MLIPPPAPSSLSTAKADSFRPGTSGRGSVSGHSPTAPRIAHVHVNSSYEPDAEFTLGRALSGKVNATRIVHGLSGIRLSDRQVQVGPELVMNPKWLGGLGNHRHERWDAAAADVHRAVLFVAVRQKAAGAGALDRAGSPAKAAQVPERARDVCCGSICALPLVSPDFRTWMLCGRAR